MEAILPPSSRARVAVILPALEEAASLAGCRTLPTCAQVCSTGRRRAKPQDQYRPINGSG
jgi:hypothetical protein